MFYKVLKCKSDSQLDLDSLAPLTIKAKAFLALLEWHIEGKLKLYCNLYGGTWNDSVKNDFKVLAACRRIEMFRTSDNGPSWK